MIFKDESGPRTGKVAPFKLDSNLRYRIVSVGSDLYCWLDRATDQMLPYKNGDEAQFNSLDDAVDAFINKQLTVERNEVMR